VNNWREQKRERERAALQELTHLLAPFAEDASNKTRFPAEHGPVSTFLDQMVDRQDVFVENVDLLLAITEMSDTQREALIAGTKLDPAQTALVTSLVAALDARTNARTGPPSQPPP
jgi:hypothetical protein